MQFKENDIILYPTDTIYGLGVDATNPDMVQRLKDLKGREEGKHISIAVSDVAMLKDHAVVTPLAEKLIEEFLPGKLTIVLEPKNLPVELGTDTGEIGVRIPDRREVFDVIQELGKPITTTSANISGVEPEKTPGKILEQFGERASWITKVIDAGELPLSEPSTVVDARGTEPVVIREGAISKVAIFEAVG